MLVDEWADQEEAAVVGHEKLFEDRHVDRELVGEGDRKPRDDDYIEPVRKQSECDEGLGLISMFTGIHIFIFSGLQACLLAMIDLADFSTPLRNMAESVERIVDSTPESPEEASMAKRKPEASKVGNDPVTPAPF